MTCKPFVAREFAGRWSRVCEHTRLRRRPINIPSVAATASQRNRAGSAAIHFATSASWLGCLASSRSAPAFISACVASLNDTPPSCAQRRHSGTAHCESLLQSAHAEVVFLRRSHAENSPRRTGRRATRAVISMQKPTPVGRSTAAGAARKARAMRSRSACSGTGHARVKSGRSRWWRCWRTASPCRCWRHSRRNRGWHQTSGQ